MPEYHANHLKLLTSATLKHSIRKSTQRTIEFKPALMNCLDYRSKTPRTKSEVCLEVSIQSKRYNLIRNIESQVIEQGFTCVKSCNERAHISAWEKRCCFNVQINRSASCIEDYINTEHLKTSAADHAPSHLSPCNFACRPFEKAFRNSANNLFSA
jgi:hypothetical protein